MPFYEVSVVRGTDRLTATKTLLLDQKGSLDVGDSENVFRRSPTIDANARLSEDKTESGEGASSR